MGDEFKLEERGEGEIRCEKKIGMFKNIVILKKKVEKNP